MLFIFLKELHQLVVLFRGMFMIFILCKVITLFLNNQDNTLKYHKNICPYSYLLVSLHYQHYICNILAEPF